ncbi:MAG: adenylate kinase [Holosporales bacterium]|jgi:adenylate kinase|nr:adenylate kinase [Holosporales bacterium]
MEYGTLEGIDSVSVVHPPIDGPARLDGSRVAVILLGAPGCGKGTLAFALQRSYGFEPFSTGDALRAEISKGSQLGVQIKALYDNGRLVSDEVVVAMVGEFLQNTDSGRVIFDGFPRTLSQAEKLSGLLADWCARVVCMDVDDDVVASRLLTRYSCKTCSKVYNEKTALPENGGVCDVCGGVDFVRRVDDTDAAILTRLQVYHEKIAPVVDYYSTKGEIYHVDASQSTENVFAVVSDVVFK